MKVNKNFVLRKVGNRTVAVPVGSTCKSFKGVIKLNDTACLVWESLLAGDSEDRTVEKMMEQYEVTEEHARSSYRATIERMEEIGVVER